MHAMLFLSGELGAILVNVGLSLTFEVDRNLIWILTIFMLIFSTFYQNNS